MKGTLGRRKVDDAINVASGILMVYKQGVRVPVEQHVHSRVVQNFVRKSALRELSDL